MSYDISSIRNKTKWKTVKAICYVIVTTMQEEVVKIINNYYIIGYQIPIERLVYVIKDHLNIGCGLHWRLDVILDEDHSRNRVGHSIENLSLLRKIVFNLVSLNKTFGEKVSMQRKLTRYMLDDRNIEDLIFKVIPTL